MTVSTTLRQISGVFLIFVVVVFLGYEYYLLPREDRLVAAIAWLVFGGSVIWVLYKGLVVGEPPPQDHK